MKNLLSGYIYFKELCVDGTKLLVQINILYFISYNIIPVAVTRNTPQEKSKLYKTAESCWSKY